MLLIEALDGATVERAGMLVAREHAAARHVRPELPAAFDSAEACTAVLQRLCDSGHHGLVATGNGRAVAVLTAEVRENPAVGRYALLPAKGFAVDRSPQPQFLASEILADRDVFHLRRDDAASGIGDLGHRSTWLGAQYLPPSAVEQ